MPQSNSAGSTELFLRVALSWATTLYANVAAAVGKIFSMMFAVTSNAESYSIIYIEAKFWVFRPFFDMVRMNTPRGAADLANVPIAGKYEGSPFFQLCAEPSPFTSKAFTVFPCRSFTTHHVCRRTMFGAILVAVACFIRKLFSAIKAYVCFCTVSPTLPTTVAGRGSSVRMQFIVAATNNAFFNNLRHVFSHTTNIAYQPIECNYIEVNPSKYVLLGKAAADE